MVLTENITLDHLGLGRFRDITNSGGKDGITIVDLAIFGQETNQML